MNQSKHPEYMIYKQRCSPFITTHHKTVTTTHKMQDRVKEVTKVRRQYKVEVLI